MFKCHIKKNDLVQVISGDDRGVVGRVLAVMPKKHKAIVEKVNMVTKHRRQRTAQKASGIITQEAPIAISKLMLVDPRTNQATRVRLEIRPDGSKVRVSKKTGNVI